ncbi:MAG: hypothetical protein JW779_12345 [Candidatus Thorarchaeota archaeon]|nr:hypothetical protein [Candidatus Thorarchaeota archaeon]
MKPENEEEIQRITCAGDDSIIAFYVGNKFYYQFHRHGSVGEDAQFTIGDTSVITHEGTETEYLHPEHMKKPGWTGGDAERGKWFFKAIKKGRTTIVIEELFRFEVESKCTINILVL